jgi:hypothetical protein
LFTSTGIIGMVEEKDMKSVLTMLPFMGALLDRMCGEAEYAPLTEVFSLHANIALSIYGHYIEMSCGFPTGDAFTETRLKELEEHIKKFKAARC